MEPVFILIFLINIAIDVAANEEYVPALIWTSPEFHERKNIDYLVQKKIKSDLFESYIMEIMGGKKPLIMVFLEENLDREDLERRDENWDNLFPFLINLTVNSRVDYFRSVQSPHQTLVQFTKKGYKWKSLKPDESFIPGEGDLWVLEFKDVVGARPETMKNHDQTMREVHRRLARSGKPWISIYTARHSHSEGLVSDLMQLSPWHVEGDVHDRSSKAISLYTDEFTGYTLITRGSIQLYLPSVKNLALKTLDSYLGASAKPSSNKMDFVIWFLNYTLTFHFNKQKGDWTIKRAKLLNGNGDSLSLMPRQDPLPKNKCYIRLTEFESEGKPIVKVKLAKYKFLRFPTHDGSCAKPYRFHLTFFLILSCLVFTAICWNRLLQNLKFSKKSKIVRISINELMSLGSQTVPYGI